MPFGPQWLACFTYGVIPAQAAVIPAPDRSPGQAAAGTSASSSFPRKRLSSPPRIGVRGRLQRGPAPRRHSRASGNPGVFSLSPLTVETVCPPSTLLPSSSATWPRRTQTPREPPPRTARGRHSYSLSHRDREGGEGPTRHPRPVCCEDHCVHRIGVADPGCGRSRVRACCGLCCLHGLR